MKPVSDLTPEDFNDLVLGSRYTGLIRRRSFVIDGEYRLLWAVLESAIKTYLANRTCSNSIQQRNFEEVRSWFENTAIEPRGLFHFRTLCDLLEIDSGRLLKGLNGLRASEFSWLHTRVARKTRPRSLAA
jgi:hypothetical protein